ncbi:MAG: hypothetical protein QOF94_1856 [Acidobacteriaceae bacterium]|nr:hypothetical protein [Alphaproteobacteria bacterium]
MRLKNDPLAVLQAGRASATRDITRLARAFGVARLEAAATRAIEIGAHLWIGPFHRRP